jgi:RNA polymerase sigma-70 factor (ECF subfamily)
VRSLDRFDRGRPFGPWLHRIVVNRAIDYARARELRREVAGVAIDATAPLD